MINCLNFITLKMGIISFFFLKEVGHQSIKCYIRRTKNLNLSSYGIYYLLNFFSTNYFICYFFLLFLLSKDSTLYGLSLYIL